MGTEDRERTIDAPEPLTSNHDLLTFESGEPVLDHGLRRRALANERSGASRTYVTASRGRVVGFYSLAFGSVMRQAAPGKIRRNTPEQIPVMIVGRLAVDRAFQRRGLGRALLRDAVLRTLQAACIAGIRAILLHALSDEAKLFYLRCGFAESPLNPMTLMISVAEAVKILSAE